MWNLEILGSCLAHGAWGFRQIWCTMGAPQMEPFKEHNKLYTSRCASFNISNECIMSKGGYWKQRRDMWHGVLVIEIQVQGTSWMPQTMDEFYLWHPLTRFVGERGDIQEWGRAHNWRWSSDIIMVPPLVSSMWWWDIRSQLPHDYPIAFLPGDIHNPNTISTTHNLFKKMARLSHDYHMIIL